MDAKFRWNYTSYWRKVTDLKDKRKNKVAVVRLMTRIHIRTSKIIQFH